MLRENSPLPLERTEELLAQRFDGIPRRLAFALRRWPLERAAVLDVGCAHGHCLAHFGPGSLGVDNVREHVDVCRALGLQAILADANEGLAACPDKAFDYAWVSDIVEHLDAPRVLLRDVASKLKPEGALLLFVAALPRSRLVRRMLRREQRNPFDARAHHYQFTYETARYLVERSGFQVTSVHVPGLSAQRSLTWAARHHAPRLFLEARPSAEAQQLALDAETRNRSQPSAGPQA